MSVEKIVDQMVKMVETDSGVIVTLRAPLDPRHGRSAEAILVTDEKGAKQIKGWLHSLFMATGDHIAQRFNINKNHAQMGSIPHHPDHIFRDLHYSLPRE